MTPLLFWALWFMGSLVTTVWFCRCQKIDDYINVGGVLFLNAICGCWVPLILLMVVMFFIDLGRRP